MSLEKLKLYSVIVGNGSGCLFQPMTEDYTYILTAKHLFVDDSKDDRGRPIKLKKPDGERIDIKRHINNAANWEEVAIEFTLQDGINYFPHKEADIAILKIDHLPDFDEIYIRDKIPTDFECVLCGFPEDFRQKLPGDRYTTHKVSRPICPGNYCHSAQLFETLSQENIRGMSGGAITEIVDNHIAIIGVQSSMSNNSPRQAGQIDFIPMKYFNEIVMYPEYSGKLEKLLPPYLRSFSFLRTDIFKLQHGLIEKKRAETLTKILKAEAIKIQNSDITPQAIKDHLREKLLLMSTQKEDELQKKKIWSVWLELLTILNIAKNNSHRSSDLSSIFKKVRLFYSDVDEDFWSKHLDELPKLDYSGLDDKSTVVVASNVEAKGMHKLDLSKIPEDIARIEQEYEIDKIGQRIDTATDFPLKKYQYVNISAFKEKTAIDVSDEFTTQKVQECLKTIKGLYEQLIPNW
jgi:hypothetical protein